MRKVLLWAARNAWLRRRVPRLWFVRRAVRRFMPGERLTDALEAAEAQRGAGLGSVFTFLGENVTDLAAVGRVVDHYHEVLDRVADRGLDAELSIKLTHLGLDIDAGAAAANLDGLVDHAARLRNWVWIDMEGSDYTEATVALFEQARARHRNVGLCLQAYLRRTPADVDRLLPLRPAIRLVKGAYDEPAAICHRSRRAVDEAFMAVGTQLLVAMRAEETAHGAPGGLAAAGEGAERVAAGEGAQMRFVAGTHDVDLVERLAGVAEGFGLGRRAVEVQMLYGVRPGEQRRLVAEGFDVRGLIAYGVAWYAWYLRRLAERPANVLFALRQLLP